jgi:type I restriction enzyme M protein
VKAIRTFDRVLANPPFSLKSWGHEEWISGDKFARDKYGCPPKSYGDLAFVQHMIASLKDGGSMGVVLPHGILFRGGAEGRIREGMLRDDLIEAVIGLAPNLFFGAGIPACITIIRKNKSPARKGKVLFIHGAEEFVSGKKQNFLTDAHVSRIATAYHAFQAEDRFSYVAEMAEIIENDFNLNIPRYVDLGSDDEDIDLAAEVRKLEELKADRDEAEATLSRLLAELGYGS